MKSELQILKTKKNPRGWCLFWMSFRKKSAGLLFLKEIKLHFTLKQIGMNLKLNADRFTGTEYINLYHRFRPTPPIEIVHQCLTYLGKSKAGIVADLGCGTGISTQVWSYFATKVWGIEPSKDMISVAKKENQFNNITYQEGYANDTGLPANSVDIVSCSQSFHWMEPISTLKEINRILKDDGVLAVYDVMWPPSANYEYENAYNKLFMTVEQLTRKLGEIIAHKWKKEDHVKNIGECGFFKYAKESYYHKTEPLDKEKFIGIALSQGGLEALLKHGFSEKEIGIIQFKNEINSIKNVVADQMTYNYRVIYGIK